MTLPRANLTLEQLQEITETTRTLVQVLQSYIAEDPNVGMNILASTLATVIANNTASQANAQGLLKDLTEGVAARLAASPDWWNK